MPSGGSAQDTGKSYLDQAKASTSDAQKKVSDNVPSGGSAQDTGKSYLDQAVRRKRSLLLFHGR